MAQSISDLLDLQPLHLPDAPSWWPLAWGWLSLIGCVSVMILLITWLILWKRKRIAPKKVALRLLQPSHGSVTPSDAMELVRQACLSYFPRQEIAHLTGHDWYAFLDEQISKPLFIPNESLWQKVLYQKLKSEPSQQHLIDDCLTWVQEALPPKRRRRR
ncbi:DUF4381 domain-containing protein [Vibrio rhizosphaerae]|uniref:DUF4381 domain-containing protein n=1 Tax=Vibrio rhizosphaerae TaxID=398736 RepID=A0ABU4IZD3_9VIBR|nr:DUF4381 domain-containing protein [Vibrio rhizosphaerae]MDW6094705.1 DUF4381 domain-containing protein [Vibrio rhizosphaerae]